MKKSLLSILALAVFATGCQNYDDQFDSLNKQITALTSKVDALDPATAADLATITGSLTTLKGLVDAMTAQNATDLTAALAKIAEITAALEALDTKVASDIAGVETSVASVTAALGENATSAEVAALQSVTDLQVELDAIKAALDGLLSAGASLKRDISITNAAELTLAESLIDATSTSDYIIEGNVLITATAAASYDNDLAAAVTRISALTAKLQTVLGNVTATTASSSVALNMDKLTYVKEGLDIVGVMPTVGVLATTGHLSLNTDDATYSLPTLVQAGTISISISSAVSVTSIQLANVTSTDGASTNATGNAFEAVDADVNLGKAGLPATVTVKSLTGGGTAYTSGTISTTGGDVALSAATVSGSLINATGNITLSGATALDSSTLAAGGNITIAAAAVAGTGYVEATAGAGGTINLSGATATGAASMNAATVSLTAAGGTISLAALKQNVTSLDLNASSVDLSALESATGVLTVVSATTLSFPALTNAAANGIIGADVTNISAPLLALTATNTVNIAADSTHEYLSIALADAAASLSLVTSDVSVLTLNSQAGTYSFTTAGLSLDGDWPRLKTLTITGKANATPASQANDIYVGSNNVSLTAVNFVGDSWINSFVSDNSAMTTLSTGGRIRSFTVSGLALLDLTFNHVEVTPGDASSILVANTNLITLDMSNSAIKTDYIYISDNASLTTVTMPAETNLPEPTAAISITIHDNALTGVWTSAVSGTGTTAYVEGAFTTTTTPVGIINLSKYVSALASQTGRTGTLQYGVEIDDASAAMTTNQSISKILSGNGTQVHYSILASAIANGIEVIDTADELALLPN